MAHRPQPVVAEPEIREGVELMGVRVGDVGEVGAEQDAVAEGGQPGQRPPGNGAIRSLKPVNAMVVSRRTSRYRSARPRKSSYSGMPMWATTSRSRGWRASTRATGSGPVCLPGAGPEPQWTTTGVPASASSPQQASSASSEGSYPPTWTCALKTRVPCSTASRT